MKLLFENAKILVKNNNNYQIIDNAYLSTKDDIISYFGKIRPEGTFDRIIDGTNKLIMPGLINAHGHSAMTLLRGVGSGLSLQDWLNKAIFPIEEKLTADDIEAGDNIAIMEMLSSGTTCYSNMYDFPFRSALTVAKSGIKANICRVGLNITDDLKRNRFNQCVDFIDILNGKKDNNQEMEDELETSTLPEVIKLAIKEGRLKTDFSIHSEYLTDESFVKQIVKANKTRNQKCQLHASETKYEHEQCKLRHNKTPIKYFYDLGYLDNGNTYIAHCVHVEDEDLKILKQTNSVLVYNPASNMKLGSGFAPICKALKNGVKIALGTDGVASNDSLDMFKEMHLVALLNAGINNNPSAIKIDDILDMATINGAYALGRKDIGEIKINYKADIILIDLNAPNLKGTTDIKTALVYSVNPSNVLMTIVDGKILYENGNFMTIDKEKAYQDFDKALCRISQK